MKTIIYKTDNTISLKNAVKYIVNDNTVGNFPLIAYTDNNIIYILSRNKLIASEKSLTVYFRSLDDTCKTFVHVNMNPNSTTIFGLYEDAIKCAIDCGKNVQVIETKGDFAKLLCA